MRIKFLSTAILIIFLIGIANAGTSGINYSVGKSATGLQGGISEGGTYQARTILTTETGGSASGSIYNAVIGFFSGKAIKSASIVYNVTLDQTEIVQAGNVYSLTIEIINSSGSVEVTSVPKITIHDALKNLVVSNVEATQIGEKKYQYNLTTNLVGVAGVKETNISVGINGETKKYFKNWTLSNGHTEIAINSVNSASSPTITADATITNEDATSYEYPYEYCIVSTITEQCGNSNNIAYGSGYKLLSSRQEWRTNLSLNIAQTGNYWFKVIAHYGTQNSGATKSFSASYTPSTSTTTGGSSSGGGGGGDSGPASSIDIQSSASASEKQIQTGVTAQFEANEKLTIIVQPSGASAGETHSVSVSNVKSDRITIIVSSNPITFDLGLGEEKEIDINGDGKKDLYFKLNKITNGKASLKIKQISSGSSPITGETINAPENLMDVLTRVLDDYKTVQAGSKILVELTMYNLGTEEIMDANIHYIIKNSDGEMIKESEETIAIYTKIQTVKEFILPANLPDGRYYIYTEINYGTEKASSETSFEIREKKNDIESGVTLNMYLLMIILGIMITLVTIFIIYIKRNNIKNEYSNLSYEGRLRHLNELRERKIINKKVYLAEKKRLLSRFEDAIKRNKIFIFLIFSGILCAVLFSDREFTGMVVDNLFSSFTKETLLLLGGIAVLGILLFVLIRNTKKIFNKSAEFMDEIKSGSKKLPANRILSLKNKKVFCNGGNYLGKVTGINLGRNKIDNLVIDLDKKRGIKAKGIIVNYSHVRSVGEVVIIDDRISKKLLGED